MTVNNNIYTFGEKILYSINPEFPPLLFDGMTKQIKELSYNRSTVGDYYTSDLRTSTQNWLCWDHWIAGIMHNMFISANNDYFHYDLDHFDSGIQATRYEVGQEYGWHIDAGDSRDKLDERNRLPRKLSMSLVLDSEFEGGDLEIFHPPEHQIKTFATPPGTVLIFPSWVSHRVTPVTSGTRFSLVAWMDGPEFK